MGTITSLQAHRVARHQRELARRRAPARATLFFDLSSPYTYLAAERAERLFAGLQWQPACAGVLHDSPCSEDAMRAASQRAALLGLPLMWPDEHPRPVRGAMRVAALATELGCGAAFVLAASRLAFCGGFDIDEPDILAEAAAAAGIDLGEMLAAAGDVGRDGLIDEAGLSLLAAGARRLPAMRVGRLLFCGEERLQEAAAARTAV
ncbi:MAG: DsbA family protein [Actinomycetota bacterium]|nr:DsbA family protein [Actinomycetota bacterium]